MEKILKDYGQYLLLEAQLPGLAQAAEDARRKALAAEREKSQKYVEWKCLENPGFFQRLLGKAEEKREHAYRAYQEAEAAWKHACQISEEAAALYQKAAAEQDALTQAKAQYAQLPKTREVQEKAVEAFRPAARYALNACLESLEQALQWENKERNVGGRMPNQDDGMWEKLSEAKAPAGKLTYILEQFPEPDSWICEYLRNPDGFIYDGVVMKVSPRNNIRTAIGQLRKLQEKLN